MKNKKPIQISESDIRNIVNKVIKEQVQDFSKGIKRDSPIGSIGLNGDNVYFSTGKGNYYIFSNTDLSYTLFNAQAAGPRYTEDENKANKVIALNTAGAIAKFISDNEQFYGSLVSLLKNPDVQKNKTVGAISRYMKAFKDARTLVNSFKNVFGGDQDRMTDFQNNFAVPLFQ